MGGKVIIFMRINIIHNENIIVLVICIDVKPGSLKSFPLHTIFCSFSPRLTVFGEKFYYKSVEHVYRKNI
jgi:hypothetical protein